MAQVNTCMHCTELGHAERKMHQFDEKPPESGYAAFRGNCIWYTVIKGIILIPV